MESTKIYGFLLVLCIAFASVHEGEAGFFSKFFKKVKRTIENATEKVSKFVNNGSAFVSNRFEQTLANMSTRMDEMENQMKDFFQKLTLEISALKECLNCHDNQSNLLRDCAEIKEANQSATNDVYRIKLFDRCQAAPQGIPCTVDVYCDMTTEGGGWTVFQRRKDGSVNFRVGWDLYQRGFGNVSGEHWLGNDIIYFMTNRGIQYELLVHFKEWEQSCYLNAVYSNFQLTNRDKYTLRLGKFLKGPVAGNITAVCLHCAKELGVYVCVDTDKKSLWLSGAKTNI